MFVVPRLNTTEILCKVYINIDQPDPSSRIFNIPLPWFVSGTIDLCIFTTTVADGVCCP